jgi:hypothetical protein
MPKLYHRGNITSRVYYGQGANPLRCLHFCHSTQPGKPQRGGNRQRVKDTQSAGPEGRIPALTTGFLAGFLQAGGEMDGCSRDPRTLGGSERAATYTQRTPGLWPVMWAISASLPVFSPVFSGQVEPANLNILQQFGAPSRCFPRCFPPGTAANSTAVSPSFSMVFFGLGRCYGSV